MKKHTRLYVAILTLMAVCVPTNIPAVIAQSAANSDARALAQSALAAMGGEARIRAIKRMRIESIGHQHLLEQSERPEGPWLVDYRDISEFRDAENARLRRTIKSRGVLSPDGISLTTIVSDGAAAYEFNGRYVPAQQSELQDAEETLVLAPERALLNAIEASDLRREKDEVLQGVNQHVLVFTWQGKPFRIFLNANTALPTGAETVSDYPYHMFWGLWGDTATRVYYSTWMIEIGGVRYPRQFDVVRQGMPFQSVTVTKLEINPAPAAEQFNITPEIKGAFGKNKIAIDDLPLGWRGRGQPQEIAKDAVIIPAGWNVALVRQPDGVVIIEGPISPGYSARVIAEAERRFPGAPIKAVISTSDAWPHIGCVREYVARGITVYALDLNRPLLERVIAAPRRNHPDMLAKNPRKPNFRIVSGKTVLGEGANRMEIYPIRGEGSERMLMVYFPESGLLYGSDLIQKTMDGSFFMPQYLSELADAVTREKLSVKSVFAMHTSLTPWNEITDALARNLSDSR